MDLKSEAAITATCYKTTNNEYEVVLAAKERDSDLVNIKLSVPFKDMAEAICDNWYQKNQQIYQYLMGELFETLPIFLYMFPQIAKNATPTIHF